MLSSRRALFVVTAVLIIAGPIAAFAEQSEPDKAKPPKSDANVVTDVAAGPSVRTVGLAGTDLQRMLRRDFSPTRLTKTLDGGAMFNLDGGFRSVLVMTIGPEGEPVTACVATEKAAEEAMAPRARHLREP